MISIKVRRRAMPPRRGAAVGRRPHGAETPMLDLLLLLVVGVFCYLAADLLLRLAERLYGRTLPERSLVFMGILLGLLLASFWAVRRLGTPGG